jgi:hypothetical protein
VWKLIKRLEQCIDEFYRWQAFLVFHVWVLYIILL